MIDLVDLWPLLCSKQCLPPAGITSKFLALWILQSIWKARNKFVFEGFSCSPEDSLSMAITLAREWNSNQAQAGSHKATRAQAPPQYPQDATIVRSDAAWSPLGTMAGLGWVLLSPSSQRPFHKRVAVVNSALMAEGLALLEAVKSGTSEHLKMVVLESDSVHLIRSLKTGSCIPELYGVAADILSFASVYDSVVFSWISQERNTQADRLAKFALNVSDNMVVDEAFMASI